MSTRKKRVVLPIEEKQKVLKIKEMHPEMKLSEIVEEYYNQSKQIISVATVQKIWANRESIRKGEDGPNGKSNSSVSISAETIKRIEMGRAVEMNITESYVIGQAQKVVQEFKLDPNQYYFSADWARDIMKGKVNDTIILKQKSTMASVKIEPVSESRRDSSQFQKDSGGEIGMGRVVGLSEGEKNSILFQSTPNESSILY